jgi:hypothetical protein
MRMCPSVLSLCLPLLTACPDDVVSAGPTTAADTTTDITNGTTNDATTTGSATTTADGSTTNDTTSSTATDSTSDATSPLDTETDTGATIPGCECILDEDPGNDFAKPSLPTCGESPCSDVRVVCPVFCESPFEPDVAAALECTLMALRDRTPGILTWYMSESDEGSFTYEGYALVNADGTAVRRNWGWVDLTYTVTDAVLGELPPPEDFDDCLASTSDVSRFRCLHNSFVSMTSVCDEGWYYDLIPD